MKIKVAIILVTIMTLPGISFGWCYCSCLHWDTGSPISGTISVSNAVLCQQVTHTSSIDDPDHWCCEGYPDEGSPCDTVTYSWSKLALTNPQSGTFNGSTTGSSVSWTAPPCTGTVMIALNADDVPDSMDKPCEGSTRDDTDIDKWGVADVTLPSGCTTGTKSATLTSEKKSTPGCSSPCGLTSLIPGLASKSISAKYENNECKWVFAVSAKKDCACRACTGYYTEISNGNDSDVTQANFCTLVNGFYNGGSGSGGGDCFSSGGVYGNSSCVQDHEDEHYNIFNGYLSPNAKNWLEARSSMELAINCSDSNTTTCGSAETYRDSAITADINTAYTQAWTWMDPAAEEAQCQSKEFPCAENLAKSICQRAKDEAGWDVDTCAQCVTWGYTD